jgi:hypothetical protein
VSREVDKLVAELSVELDGKPVVVCAVVVDEELRGHFWVEERPENGIPLSLNCGNERTAIPIRHVADGGGSEHGLETWVGQELLRWNAPVMTIIGVVVVLEEERLIGHASKHDGVPWILDEAERKTAMSQVEFLVGVSILCCEVSKLLVSHASSPDRQISPVVVGLEDLFVEEPSELLVISVTSRQEDTVYFLESSNRLSLTHAWYQRHNSGSSSLQELDETGHHIVCVVSKSGICLHFRL